MKQRIRYLSLLIVFSLFCGNLLSGQSLKRQHIGSLGSSGSVNDGLYVHLTVGQSQQSNLTDEAIQIGYEQYSNIEKEFESASAKTFTINSYPNPAKDELNIDLKESLNAGQIKIYDASGRIVYQEEFQRMQFLRLNITSLNEGMYQASIVSEENQTSFLTKFIVSK